MFWYITINYGQYVTLLPPAYIVELEKYVIKNKKCIYFIKKCLIKILISIKGIYNTKPVPK